MSYDFEFYDKEIEKTIAFRKVVYERDVEHIHNWMMEEHVHPFWNLNVPFEQFSDHLKKALSDQHQTLYIGYLDDVMMSYWESYWVKGDVVEQTYPSAPFDQGIHLLIGEKKYLGKGFSLPLLRAMIYFQFQELQTGKVIAEPDIRNDKMIHVFKKCGFTQIKPIKLPDKTGLLMFCERNEFEKRWPNVQFLKAIK
ncbi:RimJ/RimL family protein N-acetyltransferase [Bacillus pakistanensis]|uniref:Lysine N-acyltransferase MbtK n=1 Tax=Rossellomorea pakistanensis TaxID=992288 RepID=A0ABS2NID5_9BACI|nr:GNAT family N-acetyltransferase [Bacillus pakistanensis]MBM7587539.1 RimJ/RimL family protein N-acetyltransferase [Bacillus pakistanensis]